MTPIPPTVSEEPIDATAGGLGQSHHIAAVGGEKRRPEALRPGAFADQYAR
ncbi:hypothetical protein [Rhodococcus oxybenzonivorans]|uniref:hypothetical protein n=1 Tax=Rhodococcus oxybenzonivorans TaxID=1990687 RepID=UPI0029547982|nr:hypothetical protein [Rhodococcus oxybenzonivorans]